MSEAPTTPVIRLAEIIPMSPFTARSAIRRAIDQYIRICGQYKALDALQLEARRLRAEIEAAERNEGKVK